MKLLIAIPTLDYMHSEFVECLIKLTRYLEQDNVDFEVCIKSGTLVYHARDLLATKARQEFFTHVLWLDSDMIFNEEVVDDLMFHDKEYVTGIFHARRPPHLACSFKSLNPIERFSCADYPEGLFEIAGSGLACTLMSVHVLQKVWERYGTCFMPTPALGEDLAFCERVGNCGIKMYADPSVRIGHIGHIVINAEDEQGWRAKVSGLEARN